MPNNHTAQQAEPCIATWETGQHTQLHSRHQAGDPPGLFIEHCPHCGWADIRRTVKHMSLGLRIRLVMGWL